MLCHVPVTASLCFCFCFAQLTEKQQSTLESLSAIVGCLSERLDYYERTGLCPVIEGSASTSDLVDADASSLDDAAAASADVRPRSVSMADVVDPAALTTAGAVRPPGLATAVSDNHVFLRRDLNYYGRLVPLECDGDEDERSSSLGGAGGELHNRSFASISCASPDASTLSSYPSGVVPLQRSLRAAHHQSKFSQQKPPHSPPLLVSKSLGHLPSSCDAAGPTDITQGPLLDDSLPDILASSSDQLAARMHEQLAVGVASASHILLPESKYPSDDRRGADALRQSEAELELLHTTDSSRDNTLKHPKLSGCCQRGEPNASQFSTIASSGYQSGANAGSPSPPLHTQAAVGSLYSIPFADDQQQLENSDSADVTSASPCASPARFAELEPEPELAADAEQLRGSPVAGVIFSASPSTRRIGRSNTFMVAALASPPPTLSSSSHRIAHCDGDDCNAYENVHVVRAKCPSANALTAAAASASAAGTAEAAAAATNSNYDEELAAPPRPGCLSSRISTASAQRTDAASTLEPEPEPDAAREQDVAVAAPASQLANDARTRVHTWPYRCDALQDTGLAPAPSPTSLPTPTPTRNPNPNPSSASRSAACMPHSATADRAIDRLSESSAARGSRHQHQHQHYLPPAADRDAEISTIIQRFALFVVVRFLQLRTDVGCARNVVARAFRLELEAATLEKVENRDGTNEPSPEEGLVMHVHVKSSSALASAQPPPSASVAAKRAHTHPSSQHAASSSPSVSTDSQEAIYENVLVSTASASARGSAGPPPRPALAEQRGRPVPAATEHRDDAPAAANVPSHMQQLDDVSAAIEQCLKQQPQTGHTLTRPPATDTSTSSLPASVRPVPVRVHIAGETSASVISRPSVLAISSSNAPHSATSSPRGGAPPAHHMRSGSSAPSSLLLDSLRQRQDASHPTFPTGSSFRFPTPTPTPAPAPVPAPGAHHSSASASSSPVCSPVYANYPQMSAATFSPRHAAPLLQERKFSAPVALSSSQSPNVLQAIAFGSSLMPGTGGRVQGRRHEMLMRANSGPNAQRVGAFPAPGAPAAARASPTSDVVPGGRAPWASSGRILPPRFRPEMLAPSTSTSASNPLTSAAASPLPIRYQNASAATPATSTIAAHPHGGSASLYSRQGAGVVATGAAAAASGSNAASGSAPHGRFSCGSPMSPLAGDAARISTAGFVAAAADSRGAQLNRAQSTRAATARGNVAAATTAATGGNSFASLTAARLLTSSRATGSSSPTTSRAGAGNSKHTNK